MQYKVPASAFALAFIAAPASAWDNSQSNTAAPKQQEKTYCVQFDDTGSHVARIECRTKKQWAQRGVDVDNPSEK